ncbi:MAG: ribosome assembly RNA-binding protein YhbY [Gammaproteobacteria bacterium]|nr:ribosome assembly RNA-binding protein YhbY [Gammaproteobacteria bacterium]
MKLTEQQLKHLRGLAHKLKPVVMVGQHGLKETILEEIESALEFHELIKVKISVGDRDMRDEIIETILEDSRATLVQRVGNMATLFRRNPKKPKIVLSLKK